MFPVPGPQWPGGLWPRPFRCGHQHHTRRHGARDPGGQRDGHGEGGENPMAPGFFSGKIIGKPWENGGLMGFHGIYPLVSSNMAMENPL